MNTPAASARAGVDAQLRAMQPLCRAIAHKLIHQLRLPSNIMPDELAQAGMVGAWQACERFDGRGSLESFASRRIRGAMLDWLREIHPVGRNGPEVSFVSLDDTDEDGGSRAPGIPSNVGGDPAEEVERRQEAAKRVRALSRSQRGVVAEAIAGHTLAAIGAKRGVTESRACQVVSQSVKQMEAARERTPDNFDPLAVPIKVGESIPDPRRHQRGNRFRALMDRMPATGAVELHKAGAASLVAEMKKAGIRYARRTLDNGRVMVVREPSPEQFK